MTHKVSALAGKIAPTSLLVDVPKLLDAYFNELPLPLSGDECVIFGTSGHRGTSFNNTFNEWHILAITQAICLYRIQNNILGPLFLGFDTHALSMPAFGSAMEVLAANGIHVFIDCDDDYTPTPVISHAILTYNAKKSPHLADGIVITPSHNPPNYGGFKYNPPNGGPADITVTTWIENKANEFLKNKLTGIKRIRFEQAMLAKTTQRFDYKTHYINDLENVVNMTAIRDAHIHIGIDPMGGAGVHYWQLIAKRYDLHITVTNNTVDPTFAFMPVDSDGLIRMDPASSYAMTSLVNLKEHFDIAFACDTDHDRHGIVSKKAGLLSPNHYLSVAVAYLIKQRSQWNKNKSIAKTVVTTRMINWIAKSLGREVYEVPVGFKWFVDGLINESLCFAGEESAGATFDRINGEVWTTDKDGIVAALLAAEITAVTGKDIADLYGVYEQVLGKSYYGTEDAIINPSQKMLLNKLTSMPPQVDRLAGDKVVSIMTHAPGNDAAIGGIQVNSENGWFVIRASGTEAVYRVYAESFKSEPHLSQLLSEAHTLVLNTFNPTGVMNDISGS